MKLMFGQKIIAILGLLILWSLSISYWLFSTEVKKSKISKPFYGYTNGLKNPDKDFYIRQHGQYWVLYNYIRATKEFTGNESVTLVLHGDWTDVASLTETFKRWDGPISLTLFICGEDLDRAIGVILYLMHCSIDGGELKEFLSINLIMHQDFLPKYIPRFEKKSYFFDAYCFQEFNQSTINRRLQHNLSFPRNLARNVGRLTARTHFVLLLDIDIIPSAGMPKLFLKMIRARENADHPQKVAYVLPLFDIKFGRIVPEREWDFRLVDQNFLQLYLNSTSLHKFLNLREWFEANYKSVTSIFDKINPTGPWLAYYFSANDIEPFYDANDDRENQIAIIDHLDILEALDYDFYVVNLGFLVRRLLPPYKFYTEMPLENDAEARLRNRKLEILTDFLMNFM